MMSLSLFFWVSLPSVRTAAFIQRRCGPELLWGGLQLQQLFNLPISTLLLATLIKNNNIKTTCATLRSKKNH